MAERDIVFADVQRSAENRDPMFADVIIRYLEQSDPPENQPEIPPDPEDGASDSQPPPLPKDAWTMQRLRTALSDNAMAHKTASERKALRNQAWESILAAPYPPPRLQLGEMLTQFYTSGDEHLRAALMEIFTRARVGWGVWKAMKAVYKLAEEQHDAAMFGVLAYRLDAMRRTPKTNEIGEGTFIYMRRRAWRYLRQLGQAVPEIYPQFAAQVLRHYPRNFNFYSSWVASQIWAHEELVGSTSNWFGGPPKELKYRAFDKAWKESALPLLRLLEDAQNDKVCDFAIRSLQQDFAKNLRQVDPEWLRRIGSKPLASVHGFVVKLMQDSPEFHQSKLKKLGLHDMVIGLLYSDNNKAQKYAIDYARSHAPDITLDDLVRLVIDGSKEVKEFATARLSDKSPKELTLPRLVTLLGESATADMAGKKATEGFSCADLDAELYIRLATGNNSQTKFLAGFYKAAKKKAPVEFLFALLDDSRCGWSSRRQALDNLEKRPGAEIGFDWVKQALFNSDLSDRVGRWLRGGTFKADIIDVEWIKGLVPRPRLRSLALDVLGNRDLCLPSKIGLAWLLALARQADETLSKFAHRYLLENFTPEDFAKGMNSSDVEVGIDRLWSLASGPKEPESVREFAATYLKLHHPEVGPTMPEARNLGIKPRLSLESYTLQRVKPLFTDARADVRRLAQAIGRQEIVRWDSKELLYDLADSRHREPRSLAAEILLKIGEPGADKKRIPPKAWVLGARVFALAESPVKATREIALTLVRRHYKAIGGAQKLAWLMESPDREVRLFAVRLLWEKHRPRSYDADWKPAKGKLPAFASKPSERFDSMDALQHFLRTVMFGLPPGRMERRELSGDAALPDRPLAASVAKGRLLGVVCDLSLEDGQFAKLAVPILEEFAHSQAKGEWHGCVSALAQIRQQHAEIAVQLPKPAAAVR